VICDDLLAVMKTCAEKSYPNEACGLVVRVGKKSRAIECINVSATPATHFLISPQSYAQVADVGEVVGVWHTHVNGPATASPADMVGCENSEVPWYIVAIHKTDSAFGFSEMVIVEPSGFELPYLERPYAFGVLDCWSLVRDYYRREFDIALGDYPRIERFWANGHNFFGECWPQEGLVRVDGQEPQVGDLFFIQTDGTGNPNHVAIYIGDELILHHCHGRLSRRDVYGGYWAKHTQIHTRHKSKC